MFGGQSQPAVQVVSMLNTQTQQVTIIDSRIITTQQTKAVRVQPVPVGQSQTIPLAAIPAAIRKFPEIRQIILSAEKTGKVESLIV